MVRSKAESFADQAVKRNQRKVRSGYVLVLVLVSLILAATLLVQLASRTKELRVQGIDSVESLQEKWGQQSCERAAIGQAAAYFDGIEKNRGPKLALVSFRVTSRLLPNAQWTHDARDCHDRRKATVRN